MKPNRHTLAASSAPSPYRFSRVVVKRPPSPSPKASSERRRKGPLSGARSTVPGRFREWWCYSAWATPCRVSAFSQLSIHSPR